MGEPVWGVVGSAVIGDGGCATGQTLPLAKQRGTVIRGWGHSSCWAVASPGSAGCMNQGGERLGPAQCQQSEPV